MTDSGTDTSRPDARPGTRSNARPGVRARRRARVEADVLRVGRDHLATHGAAGLSLRAVARDLGMVSSGIYRYVESRDELLTRLIVESYTALADAVRTRHAAVDPADLIGRWDAIGHALRDWGLRHPHDFALLYGSPVPEYQAPPERTNEAGTAVLLLLVDLLVDVHSAGRLAAAPPDLPEQAMHAVDGWLDDELLAGTGLPVRAIGQGLAAWTLLLGAVTSEVFQQLGPVPDADGLFALFLATARHLFLAPAS